MFVSKRIAANMLRSMLDQVHIPGSTCHLHMQGVEAEQREGEREKDRERCELGLLIWTQLGLLLALNIDLIHRWRTHPLKSKEISSQLILAPPIIFPEHLLDGSKCLVNKHCGK